MKFLGIHLKQRIIQQAACWTGETECGCYAKDEEIPIKEDQCVLNLGTFPDVAGFWKFTFELKINSLPTEMVPLYSGSNKERICKLLCAVLTVYAGLDLIALGIVPHIIFN